MIEVEGIGAQNLLQGLAPSQVHRERVPLFLRQAFECVADDVNAVAGGKFQVELVCPLQKFNGYIEQFALGKWQVIAQNFHLVLTAGKTDFQRRL